MMNKSAHIIILILVLSAVWTVAASAQEVSATAEWGVPTYGTPVEHYVLQHSVNGGEWITIATPTATSYAFLITEGDAHRVRVAAVDAEGRQGPYCSPSEDYVPGGGELEAPGQPGKPLVY